jgi:hypothetical protein
MFVQTQDDDQPPSALGKYQRSAKPDGQNRQATRGSEGSRFEPPGDFVGPVQRKQNDGQQRRDGQWRLADRLERGIEIK